MRKFRVLIILVLSIFYANAQEVVELDMHGVGLTVHPEIIPAGKPDSVFYQSPGSYKAGDIVYSKSLKNSSFDVAHKILPPFRSVLKSPISICNVDTVSLNGFNVKAFKGLMLKQEEAGIQFSKPRIVAAQSPRYKDNAVLDIKYYDVSQGLSNSYVLDIFQDKYGLLWFATNGGGVCRFDGENFEIYNENSGIADNMVVSLASDSDESLWIATMNGLSFYNYRNFYSFRKENGMSSNYLTDVLVDRKGVVWVATENNGLNIFNGERFIVLDSTNGISDQITTLYEDSDGRIWFGSFGGGLYVYDNGEISQYRMEQGLLSNHVRDISGNSYGGIAIAYDKGVDIIQSDSVLHYTVKQGISDDAVNVLLFFDDGDVVFGTKGSGLFSISKESITVLNSDHGLNNDAIWALLKDESGVFWIGTWGGGVSRYDGFSFVNLGVAQGLPSDLIPSMTNNSEGENWYGTYDNGFFSMNSTYILHYGEKQGFSARPVWSMLFNRYGELWLATGNSGLWLFNGNTFKVYNTEGGFPSNSVWSLWEDRKGNLWIGTVDKGLIKYDGNKFYKIGITGSSIVSLFEDSKGNMWVSTWGDGVYKIGRHEILHFDENSGFPAQKVYNVFEDNDGYLWFATNGNGLLIYNGSAFSTITTETGIGSDFNFWVVQMEDESLMIGTESGLSHMKLLESTTPKYPKTEFVKFFHDSANYRMLIDVDGRRYSISNYGVEDGFIGFDCIGSQFSSLKDKQGNLWLGTGKHLTRFNPTHQIKDLSQPKVHLKDISISLQPIDWARLQGNSLTQDITFDSLIGVYQIPNGLKLGYTNNHLTFDFIGINWKTPDRILYQYRLNGYEEEWSYPTRISMATYSNLPPGQYSFEVKAKNIDNIWSEPYVFDFVILTPWWQTIWFQLLFLIIVSSAVYLFIRWRILRLKQQKDKLERIVKERTKEVVLQNEEIKSQRDHLNTVNNELERLSIVASETRNGVLIADSRGNIEYINYGYTQLLGYSLDELTAAKGPNLFFIYKSENTLKFIQKCRDEKRSVSFSSQFEKRNGSLIWVQVTVTPILETNGNMKKYVVIYADITSLKNAQLQIENYNKEITASIRYASRIQSSMLPIHKEIKIPNLDTFVIYQPQDIVGGDFYWFSEHGDNFLLGVIDCTGHSVPGALMTVISYAALNSIVNDDTARNPAELLQLLNKEIRKMLRQQSPNDGVSDDGLDASFCYVMPKQNQLIFAGAMQSLFYADAGDLTEVRGDRQSVGYIDSSESYVYTNHEIPFTDYSVFYMASDGYKDMAVGDDGHILGKRRLREMLHSVSYKTLEEQHRQLEGFMYRSVAVNGQIDDIVMIGFQILQF